MPFLLGILGLLKVKDSQEKRHSVGAGYCVASAVPYVTAGGTGVVSHAGTRLLADVADAVGVSAAFADALGASRRRRSAHDPGRVPTDGAVKLADGGEAITDLAVLRDQPDVFGAVASLPTPVAGVGRRG